MEKNRPDFSSLQLIKKQPSCTPASRCINNGWPRI